MFYFWRGWPWHRPQASDLRELSAEGHPQTAHQAQCYKGVALYPRFWLEIANGVTLTT